MCLKKQTQKSKREQSYEKDSLEVTKKKGAEEEQMQADKDQEAQK